MLERIFRRFKKVLIIEDDNALRAIIAERVAGAGFRVLEAANGSDGFLAAVEEHPHLILLDLMMPKTDGINFLSELRSEGEWGSSVPVIILTNLMQDEKLREYVLKYSVAKYIEKVNLKLDDLLGDIAKLI